MADKMERLKKKDLNKQEEQLNDRIMLKRVRSQEKFGKLGVKSQTMIEDQVGDKVGNGENKLLRGFI